VSAPSPHRSPDRTGLLGKLLARVRPEFRVQVYLADPDDPVMGRRPCAVPDCDRSRAESGLCSGHGRRWRARGRPALAVFLADPGPTLNGRRDLTPARCRDAVTAVAVRDCVCVTGRPGPATAGQIPTGGPLGRVCSAHPIPRGACCRFARCGPRTPGIGTASPTRRGGGNWAVPTARTTSRTACSAARPASTSARWRPGSHSSCSTRFSVATTRPRSSPRRRS
jgi:hypothetical protein